MSRRVVITVGLNKMATCSSTAVTPYSNDMIGAEAKQDSNNDRTRWDLLDLLVEQIGAEHHWIKVKQSFEYQTYFARYSICCKCV